MGQTVQKRAGQAFVLEDLPPIGESQVRRDNQAPPFIAYGEDLEQEFGAGLGEGQVPEFVHDQDIELVKLLECPLQPVFLPGLFQGIRQPSGGEEADPVSLPARRQSPSDPQVGLSRTGIPERDEAGFLLDPATIGQGDHLLFVQARDGREIERVEILVHGKSGRLDPPLQRVGLTVLHFHRHQVE